jgi:hypothetical protein
MPSEQKFNFRGMWNPCDGSPVLSSKYDAYIVSENYKQFSVGDWIVRNQANTAYTHININSPMKIMAMIDYVPRKEVELTNREHLGHIAYLEQEISKLSIKLSQITNMFISQLDEVEHKMNDTDAAVDCIIQDVYK